MFIAVGVLCRISYSVVSYSYVSCSGSTTSVGEEKRIERESFSAILHCN